ncbi:metallophosphoesterase [Pseudonocardia sp. DR1-2]|uniref:metallophosphoesterase n=1 Tax=Pseudonocardia sp. DR1-2 TaxID=2951168 RepID=UPI002043FDF2|nr:metallophosphoesterase [Pseudonocardia sp. DR1-2]MCM3848921.1 metallophosphoesterase [Pseudonocardia sp. DR1-2]
MSVNPTGETPGVGVPRALAVDMTIADQQDWLAAFLRRHPVSRRTALRGGAGVLATLAASGSPWARGVAAAAAPAPVTVVGRHLAYGPDPARSMSFSGELTAAPPPGRMVVDVGTDSGFGLTLPVQVRPLESLVPQVDGSIRGTRQWFAHARPDGLTPGSRYVYRFRIEGPGGTTATTATSTFRTAAPRGTRHRFTFTAFADQGVSTGGEPNHYKPDDTHRSPAPAEALTALVAAEAPAFHLLAGDICYADPSGAGRPVRNGAPQDDEAHDSFDPTVWSTYFAAIERSAASTPWMFATGNHDMEALYDLNRADGPAHGYAGHAARLALPGTGPRGCPSVYAFTHGTVGVVSVDANDLSTEIPTNAGYSGGTQLTWLERTLAGWRADPDVEWIVLFFHHCAFATSGSHASDAGVRRALAPLCDRYRVDLCVQGHNHQYERTDPIRDGRPTRPAPDRSTVHPETDGTTYVCVGSGGRPRYRWQPGETDSFRGHETEQAPVTSFLAGPDDQKQAETVTWSRTRYLGYAYLRCSVVPGSGGTDSRLVVHAISDLGEEIDMVRLSRRARR